MAWYEQSGPDAAAVRKSVKQHYMKNGSIGSLVLGSFQQFPQCYQIMADRYLDGILKNRINGKEGDYGSWRGFATFGLSPEIERQIEGDIQAAIVDINRQFAAQKILNAQVEDFGMAPPQQLAEGEEPTGLLNGRGGGMFLEVARTQSKNFIN